MMRRLPYLLVFFLAGFLILQSAYSLEWPIAHDEAPLFYEAFLMRVDGLMPYRDIFDFQMPGSYVAYYVIGRLAGFDDFRIRILDLVILTAIIIITFLAMRRFGKPSALAAGILFGLKYLQGGPSLSLQREYLLLVFLALSLFVGMHDSLTPWHRLALGLLFGLSAVIKPHAALGLLPYLLFDIIDMVKRQSLTFIKAAAKSIFPAGVGFAIPIIAVIAWLGFTGALIPFLEIASNYWPLYAQINGALVVNAGAERMLNILNQVWRLGGNGIWLIPAAFGVFLNRNKRAYLLASLALCYAVYPALSGQFFPYHYIPFVYLILLLASLSLMTTSDKPTPVNLLSSFVLLVVILVNVRPSPTFVRQVQGQTIATSTDRAVEIARFLDKYLEDGDEVQPLDWTGGTLLVMLETRARIATPYVFDFYFYHHVSSPYIQSLRADFIDDLQESRPRFMIEVTSIDKPWVAGEDTSKDFPELRKFIEGNYETVLYKEDYVIYERR